MLTAENVLLGIFCNWANISTLLCTFVMIKTYVKIMCSIFKGNTPKMIKLWDEIWVVVLIVFKIFIKYEMFAILSICWVF